MSDPVTNVNIDDVLSSIRRLVTEGERPNDRSAPGQGVPDRLVLTPDHRVNLPEQDAAKNDVEQADGEETDAVARALADDHSLDNLLILQAEQSVPAETPMEPLTKGTLAATIAAVEARVGDAEDEWEPDEGEDIGKVTQATWTSNGFVAAPRNAPSSDTAEPTSLEEEVAASIVRETFIPRQTKADAPAIVEEKPFAPRSRFTPMETDPRPMAVSTHDDDADYGDELAQANQYGTDDTLDHFLNRGPMIDEEKLRELVKEVVREELQGNLGERITRNVRKLVRREIHNILTTQEFN